MARKNKKVSATFKRLNDYQADDIAVAILNFMTVHLAQSKQQLQQGQSAMKHLYLYYQKTEWLKSEALLKGEKMEFTWL